MDVCKALIHGHLPPKTTILGYARSKMDTQKLRDQMKSYLKGPADIILAFLEICYYEPGEYSLSCDTEGPLVFGKLAETVAAHERRMCGGGEGVDIGLGVGGEVGAGRGVGGGAGGGAGGGDGGGEGGGSEGGKGEAHNRIFYLALPPSVYPPVCANIKVRGCRLNPG